MPNQRPNPIIVEPPDTDIGNDKKAAFIFMHGLGDDGESFRDLANQFHSLGKLPYLTWVLPTAKENMDLMTRAWYLQTKLPAVPNPRPELDDDEDEDGFLESSDYILSLVDDLVAKGIPLSRIAVGGFSQGCALSLFMGTSSKYAGQFAGICGLMGYFPLSDRAESLRKEHAPDADISEQPVLICRGTRDMLVPSRYYKMCLEKLEALGVNHVEAKEHAVGHSLSGPVIQDVCVFLERVLPPK